MKKEQEKWENEKKSDKKKEREKKVLNNLDYFLNKIKK